MMKPFVVFLGAIVSIVFPPVFLHAQSADEPMLIIHCEQSGAGDGYSWNTTADAAFKLCRSRNATHNTMPAAELYALRRSVKGMKAGEVITLYCSEKSGSGTDSDRCRAVMVPLGDSRSRTTVTCPGESRALEDHSGASPNCGVHITRTAQGARLSLDPFINLYTGGYGYFHDLQWSNVELTKKERTELTQYHLSEAQLDHWQDLSLSRSGSALGPGGQGTWSYKFTITTRLPDLGELAVEVVDWDNWIPKGDIERDGTPGAKVKVKAWVRDTGESGGASDRTATVTFELTETGREKGVCVNWPDEPGESDKHADLCITEKENPALAQVRLESEAKTREPVKKTEVIISSFDYGAWGTLRVRAVDKDGKPMKVVYVNKKDIDRISIPKDEDHNRIADAWQEEKGVVGLPADWDEAVVPGQDVKGDGIPLYEKYRGFAVIGGGGRKHVRLDPREKAHFVIDTKMILDEGRWLASTGIHIYKILQEWTDDRRVDVNRGFSGGKGKWATRLEVDETPVNGSAPEAELKKMRQQWATTISTGAKWIGTPKNVKRCVIYAGRIRYTLCWLRDNMLRCLQSPANDGDREEAAFLLSLGLSRDELIAKLKATEIEPLVQKLKACSAIHEVGHSCGVNGHLGVDGQETELSVPYVPDCPSQYMTWQDKRRLLLFGQMGDEGKFCDVEPHHCWRSLSPKD